MNTVYHPAATRGHASHGWLESYHTFSFAGYYDPSRMHFGALRVLNDDSVTGGAGFGRHPHDNMEIVSIPLEGDLEHADSLGNTTVIREGDVQAMSAGTGVLHSEKNSNTEKAVRFLQIWIIPNERGVTPRYDQKTFTQEGRTNRLQTVISPIGRNGGGVEIHQDAWFHRARIEAGKSLRYDLKDKAHGVYLFVLEGSLEAAGTALQRRDGLGVQDADGFDLKATTDTDVLLMEVPMI